MIARAVFQPWLAALPAACLLLAASAGIAGAQVSATGGIDAEVLAPLTVANIDDLDFGIVDAGDARPGRVVVTPGERGARYVGTSAGCAAGSACPPPHPARFSVLGEPGRNYLVLVPDHLNVTGDQAMRSVTLEVSRIAVRVASHPAQGNRGTLDAVGRDEFEVGGQLVVPAGAPRQRYRLTIPVILQYN